MAAAADLKDSKERINSKTSSNNGGATGTAGGATAASTPVAPIAASFDIRNNLSGAAVDDAASAFGLSNAVIDFSAAAVATVHDNQTNALPVLDAKALEREKYENMSQLQALSVEYQSSVQTFLKHHKNNAPHRNLQRAMAEQGLRDAAEMAGGGSNRRYGGGGAGIGGGIVVDDPELAAAIAASRAESGDDSKSGGSAVAASIVPLAADSSAGADNNFGFGSAPPAADEPAAFSFSFS